MPRIVKRRFYEDASTTADYFVREGFGMEWAIRLARNQLERADDRTRYFWQHVVARIEARRAHK